MFSRWLDLAGQAGVNEKLGLIEERWKFLMLRDTVSMLVKEDAQVLEPML